MTDNWTPTAVVKAFRSVCALLDTGIYALLGFMYEIFFNVATADILSNETILSFYKRVQLIIGVYMVFNLAIIIMKGIVSPDTVTDNKSGMGGFIKRIILALVMLTVLTPISIPSASNEFEKQLNNNGLLFGTLYSLQYRILNNNTLGRLILGTNDTSSSSSSSSASGLSGATTQAETLQKSANIFTATILKGFVRINLVPEDERKDPGDGKSEETLNENRMCQDIDDDTLAIYTATDASPGDILSLINATCTPDSNALTGAIYSALTFFGLSNKTKFAFSYMPIISGAIGIVFIFIFISFTVDVAIRAIKLAVLRLLAPIPVIQYMDPSGKGDNAFNGWVKTVSQTYLDLFIRLASVYFVIFIIQDICTNGIAMNVTGNAVGVISFIFICIGLFAFAKQAPKFIQDLLGLKNPPVGSFGRAFGTMAATAGAIGSFNSSRMASRAADETNGKDPNSFFNRGKHLLAGMAGGITGFSTGVNAYNGAKDHKFKAAFDAQYKRNQMDIGRGQNGSTFLGRAGTIGQRLVTGQDAYDREAHDMNIQRAKEKAGKDLFSYLEGKGKTDAASWKVNTEYKTKDAHGVETTHNLRNVSVNDFTTAWNKARADRQQGRSTKDYFEISGEKFNIDDAETQKALDEITFSAGTEWSRVEDGKAKPDDGYAQKREDFEYVGGTFQNTPDPTTGKTPGVSQVKKDYKKAGGAADHIERSRDTNRHKADHGATGGGSK